MALRVNSDEIPNVCLSQIKKTFQKAKSTYKFYSIIFAFGTGYNLNKLLHKICVSLVHAKIASLPIVYKPHHMNTCLWELWPGKTQISRSLSRRKI